MTDRITASEAGAFDLLSRMRFACGDNGKRMQDELEVYLRELKRDADMWRADISDEAVDAAVEAYGEAAAAEGFARIRHDEAKAQARRWMRAALTAAKRE